MHDGDALMETRRKNQFLFYMDIVILGVGAVALVLLVHDAFTAGFTSQTNPSLYEDLLWNVVVEAVVVGAAMTYFLVRFFRIRVRELSNPWG